MKLALFSGLKRAQPHCVTSVPADRALSELCREILSTAISAVAPSLAQDNHFVFETTSCKRYCTSLTSSPDCQESLCVPLQTVDFKSTPPTQRHKSTKAIGRQGSYLAKSSVRRTSTSSWAKVCLSNKQTDASFVANKHPRRGYATRSGLLASIWPAQARWAHCYVPATLRPVHHPACCEYHE